MSEQKGRSLKSTNFSNNDILHVNNSGYYENKTFSTKIDRPKGRVDYLLILIEKGVVYISLNGEILKLQKNDFFIFAPNTPQQYSFEKDTLYNFYWVHFTGVYIPTLLGTSDLHTNTVYNGDISSTFIIKDAIKQITDELQVKNYNYETVASGILHSLFAKLPRYLKNNRNPKDFIESVIETFNKDFVSINDISAFAKRNGLSPTYFIRLFKQHTSLTPKQYILRLRMEKAKQLLSVTDMKINEVARECGFESPLYFSKLFHKHFGVPPTRFS